MTLQAKGGRKAVNVGNYRFTGKRLGKGNFARVEEAVHSVLNTKVALKIMDVTLIKEDYVIKNLYREARIMSRLFHPCIAALFQTMQFGNVYYLVMELVGGGDLCTFIKAQRNGKLDERCSRVFARQLVSAISHMHHLGIVHRDLKMENVMLNVLHTQIKIVDFGLSNAYTENNPLRTHCGSPEYAAPELFMEGKQYGPEVDLWSLGVILYGMVTGQLPFVTVRENNMTSQERRKKLLEQINKGIVVQHRRALAVFSADFSSMITKLLMPDSARRMCVKELIVHPWITEKGKKSLRSNPMKKLDGQSQSIIMKDVSSLLRLNLSEVDFAVKSEPQGNIAGIYNILAFRQTLRQLDGDGVTRNIPDQAINYLGTPRGKCHGFKEVKQIEMKSGRRKEMLKSAPLPKQTQLKITKPAPGICNKTYNKLEINDKVTHKKKVIPKDILCKWDKLLTPRPPPADCMGVQPSRHIVSANDSKRPKIVDSKITTKFVGQGEGNANPFVKLFYHKESISKNSAKEKQTNTRSAELETTEKTKTSDTKTMKTSEKLRSSRIQSATVNSMKTNTSERPRLGLNHTQRPLTEANAVERTLKRRSYLPVTINAAARSRGASSTARSHAPYHHQQQQQQQRQQIPDQPPLSGGAPARSPRSRDPEASRASRPALRHFANEPIARSIAGYVVNNIPAKLQGLKWIGGKAAHVKKESVPADGRR